MPSAYLGGQVQEAASATVRKSHDRVRALLEIFRQMVKLPRKYCALILVTNVNKSIYTTAKNVT